MKRKDEAKRYFLYANIMMAAAIVLILGTIFYPQIASFLFRTSNIVNGIIPAEHTSLNDTIFFLQEDIDFMNKMYETYDNEFMLCFKLDKQNNAQIVKTIMTTSEFGKVTATCPYEANLNIHSHPHNWCFFSQKDYTQILENAYIDYMGLSCGEDMLRIIDTNGKEYDIAIRVS